MGVPTELIDLQGGSHEDKEILLHPTTLVSDL